MNNFMFQAMRRPINSPSGSPSGSRDPLWLGNAPHAHLRTPATGLGEGLGAQAAAVAACRMQERSAEGNRAVDEEGPWWDPLGFSLMDWGGDEEEWWAEIGHTVRLAGMAPVTTFQLVGQAIKDALLEEGPGGLGGGAGPEGPDGPQGPPAAGDGR